MFFCTRRTYEEWSHPFNVILLSKAGNVLGSIQDQFFIYQDTTTSYIPPNFIPPHVYHLNSMWLIVSQDGLDTKSERTIQIYFLPALPLPAPFSPNTHRTAFHPSSLSKTTKTHTHTLTSSEPAEAHPAIVQKRHQNLAIALFTRV